MVSGPAPAGMATSATVSRSCRPPWPTSNTTPRCLAASAERGSSLPSWTYVVNSPPMFGRAE
jgi:hypothetical protein